MPKIVVDSSLIDMIEAGIGTIIEFHDINRYHDLAEIFLIREWHFNGYSMNEGCWYHCEPIDVFFRPDLGLFYHRYEVSKKVMVL